MYESTFQKISNFQLLSWISSFLKTATIFPKSKLFRTDHARMRRFTDIGALIFLVKLSSAAGRVEQTTSAWEEILGLLGRCFCITRYSVIIFRAIHFNSREWKKLYNSCECSFTATRDLMCYASKIVGLFKLLMLSSSPIFQTFINYLVC